MLTHDPDGYSEDFFPVRVCFFFLETPLSVYSASQSKWYRPLVAGQPGRNSSGNFRLCPQYSE